MSTVTREHVGLAALRLKYKRDRASVQNRRSFDTHPKALAFIESAAKRKVARAGRRGAKTTSVAELALRAFEQGRRVLYAVPTVDQLDAFWHEVKRALEGPLDAGTYYKNESNHVIEVAGTKQRIRAKTAWNADTLRGDFADLLILDEWQLMDEEAWDRVGAPMLLDNDGDAVFVYTPPSLASRSTSKARDPRHASKLFERAQEDTTGRWETFHWTSHDNPFISSEALTDIVQDMTSLSVRQEIYAEDVNEAPGALWTRQLLDDTRVPVAPEMQRIVIGVDPPGGSTECGIVVVGLAPCNCKGHTELHQFVIDDLSLLTSPDGWGSEVLRAWSQYEADLIVGEANYGGDMVEAIVRAAAKTQDESIAYRTVQATRGKAVRAEPVVAAYERSQVHHVGIFPELEDEQCQWIPGVSGQSPNRMDALVWAQTELIKRGAKPKVRVSGSKRGR